MLNGSIALMKRRPGAYVRADAAALRSKMAVAACAVLLAATLAGCGEKKKPTGQVVAKVNGEEITIHQLKSEFSALTTSSADQAKLTRTILDSLIDEQLLVEYSKERKLDRDPQVMQALEKARRQILAQAIQDSLAMSSPRPTAAEVRAFYEAQPALFEKRRIYTFHQFIIDRASFSDALKAKLDKAKSDPDVVKALKEQKIGFRELLTAKPAEQLPMEVLPRIAAMAKGDLVVLNNGAETTIMRLVDFVEQPATVQQATPVIEQYLINARKKDLLDAKLKTLRTAAKIEYLGPFADPQPATTVATTQQPAAAGASKGTGEAAGEDYLRRGVLGVQK